MVLIIAALGTAIYFLFKSLKTKNKEIKELKAEIEKMNQNVSVLTEFVKEQKEIKNETKKVEKEIQNAQTDEEVLNATIDLLGLLITGNQMVVTQKHNF
jgi:predicted RNase H-like nuclease (RuvC/YqgF family)